MQTRQFINGRFTEGQSKPITLLNPSDESKIADIPSATPEQVEEAVRAASHAFISWSRTTPHERSLILLKIADRVEAHIEELAELEILSTGKPRRRFLEDEIHHLLDPLRFYAGAVRTSTGVSAGEYVTDTTSFTRRDPIGVCALILPWNYPLMMAIWKLAPALAAGNTVVMKPAEQTPLSLLSLCELISDLLPAGTVNVVTGDGAETGNALVTHPAVRLVSLTGDVSTGKVVMRSAADSLKRVHLELGGKAPVIVHDDADIASALPKIAAAAMYNAGQDCTAACRVYAHSSVYEEVVKGLTEEVQKLQIGGPDDDAAFLGPLISKTRVTIGGTRCQVNDKGWYFAPTVIADVSHDDELVQKEIFGPIVTITPFDSDEQVLEWANTTEYGLAASVWSASIRRAMRFSRELQYGCVWVNEHLLWPTELPHGGLKASGMGKEMSIYGLDDYSCIRHVMISHC
jgi:aminobutyraldehyde dehydrogenase